MEIKRRLNKVARRLSPQIEVMNVANEMRQITARLEELVTYAEQKIERTAERERLGIKTIGQQVAERRAAEQREIEDHQRREAEENLRDQQESFEERNNPQRPQGDAPPSVEEQLDVSATIETDMPMESRN